MLVQVNTPVKTLLADGSVAIKTEADGPFDLADSEWPALEAAGLAVQVAADDVKVPRGRRAAAS